MSCGAQTQKNCQLKYVPIIPVVLGNENKSHITPQPNLTQVNPNYTYPSCCSNQEGPPICTTCHCGGQDPKCSCTSCYDKPTGHQRQCECPQCVISLEKEQEKECLQHVEGNRWRDLRRKSQNPEIQEIRDRLSSSSNCKDNLKWCPSDENLTCVQRRFRYAPTGHLGQATVHYGAAQDKDVPREIIHGNPSEILTPAGDLLNPPLKHWVEKLEEDIYEGIYWSNKVMPIGRSHDQRLNLPPHIDQYCTSFGKPTEKNISAGLLVNPPKDIEQVKEEAEIGRPMYRMTHGEYHPGEQICRNYSGNFQRNGIFGKQTPNDVAGRWAKKVMSTWRSCEPDLPYVNKTYADHLDQRIPKLGIAQDKNCIYRDRGPEYVYGKASSLERERPIREIIFNRCPNPGAEKAEKLMKTLKMWVMKMRKQFKCAKGTDMEQLYEEFIAADTDCNGTIDWVSFAKALCLHRAPSIMDTKDFMESLAMVGIYHPAACDKINYYLLMDLLQGHEDPKFFCKTTTLKPYYIPHTNGNTHFRTTYSDLTANMCVPQTCIQTCKEQRNNGMPSIRTDKTPHKIRSTKDTTNYGDDGDAYSLIFPSVYTAAGLTCRDAFREYSQEQMRTLFCRACVEMTREEFDCVWEAAKKLDPEGKDRVSYQTMREALCLVRGEIDQQTGYKEEVQITPSCENDMANCQTSCKPRKRNPCAGVDP